MNLATVDRLLDGQVQGPSALVYRVVKALLPSRDAFAEQIGRGIPQPESLEDRELLLSVGGMVAWRNAHGNTPTTGLLSSARALHKTTS